MTELIATLRRKIKGLEEEYGKQALTEDLDNLDPEPNSAAMRARGWYEAMAFVIGELESSGATG